MAKSINDKAVKFLVNLRKVAVKKEIHASKAISMMLDAIPEITRSETYNSAEVAGINRHTARGVFDRRAARARKAN